MCILSQERRVSRISWWSFTTVLIQSFLSSSWDWTGVESFQGCSCGGKLPLCPHLGRVLARLSILEWNNVPQSDLQTAEMQFCSPLADSFISIYFQLQVGYKRDISYWNLYLSTFCSQEHSQLIHSLNCDSQPPVTSEHLNAYEKKSNQKQQHVSLNTGTSCIALTWIIKYT